jgi:hypothetical protein
MDTMILERMSNQAMTVSRTPGFANWTILSSSNELNGSVNHR